MRDLIITLIVVGALPYILMRPHIGILVWSWLSYMNPHRLSWGFAYNLPFAQIVAVTLFAALLFSKEKKRIPITALTTALILFVTWVCITTVFAIYPDSAQEQLIKVLKIQLIVFLSLMLMNTRERIHALVWVIFLSIGFFGIKGGLFTILTGGGERVWGPPGSFIAGNNELALATLMVVPLGIYLRETASNVWIKRALIIAILLMLVSSLGSQSRGALLAFLAVAGYFWLKSPKKVLIGGLASIIIVMGFMFMPQSWHDRMSTIETYEEDKSAMGRINAWTFAVEVANNRISGGGLEVWSAETFDAYGIDSTYWQGPHSVYFEILGEQGYIGLVLFFAIWMLTFREARWIVKKTEGISSLAWANVLAKMVPVGLIAYAVGGAFLGLAYFDLPYHFMVIIVLTKVVVQKDLLEINAEDKKPLGLIR